MTTSDLSRPLAAPTDWPGFIKQLGPGILISAVIVGSGALIVEPGPRASVTFTLLRFIILSCFINMPSQTHV